MRSSVGRHLEEEKKAHDRRRFLEKLLNFNNRLVINLLWPASMNLKEVEVRCVWDVYVGPRRCRRFCILNNFRNCITLLRKNGRGVYWPLSRRVGRHGFCSSCCKEERRESLQCHLSWPVSRSASDADLISRLICVFGDLEPHIHDRALPHPRTCSIPHGFYEDQQREYFSQVRCYT